MNVPVHFFSPSLSRRYATSSLPFLSFSRAYPIHRVSLSLPDRDAPLCFSSREKRERTGRRQRGLAVLDVYLFERSKNYRSGAASRRCLPFDREATTREFARYLPRETRQTAPLGSAPLCAVRMSARAQ